MHSALEGPTFPTVNPVGVEGSIGFRDPQVKTCGYPRLAPSGPDRRLLIPASMPRGEARFTGFRFSTHQRTLTAADAATEM